MATSVRLDEETENLLLKTARALRTTKSEVLKASIHDYCIKTLAKKRKTAYELISDLLGTESSTKGNLGIDSEEILRERFRKKR